MEFEYRNQRVKRLLSLTTWVEVGAFTGAAFGAVALFIVAVVIWSILGMRSQVGFFEQKSTLLLLMLPLAGLFCGAGAGILTAFGLSAYRKSYRIKKLEQPTPLKKGA